MKTLTSYPGGKNGGGAYQKIICQVPPHEVFIELFGGSAAITKRIKPSHVNYVIEKDKEVYTKLKTTIPHGTIVINGCAIKWLQETSLPLSTFIYADPPYPINATRSKKRIYHNSLTDQEHEILLRLLTFIPANIAISSYHNELYDTILKDWRQIEYPLMTRKGWATEVLYMNYPEPIALHDYSMIGENAMKRQMFKRKKQRWEKRLANMDIIERQAIMQSLLELENKKKSL